MNTPTRRPDVGAKNMHGVKVVVAADRSDWAKRWGGCTDGCPWLLVLQLLDNRQGWAGARANTSKRRL